ncbi:MAG: hypothetical protein ACOY93_12290 [Bacillota bacterium]
MNQRPLVAPCYDHLGGILGERLARRLVEAGWVTPDPNPGVTPLGWTGFRELGLDLGPLTAGRRKPVAFCAERRNGRMYDHIGAHLGFLLQQHFIKSGWLRATGDGLELTPAGEQALQRLGVTLEEDA